MPQVAFLTHVDAQRPLFLFKVTQSSHKALSALQWGSASLPSRLTGSEHSARQAKQPQAKPSHSRGQVWKLPALAVGEKSLRKASKLSSQSADPPPNPIFQSVSRSPLNSPAAHKSFLPPGSWQGGHDPLSPANYIPTPKPTHQARGAGAELRSGSRAARPAQGSQRYSDGSGRAGRGSQRLPCPQAAGGLKPAVSQSFPDGFPLEK